MIIPKNKNKMSISETIVVSGLFLSAFYFFFFDKINKKVSIIYKDSFSKEEFSDKPRIEDNPMLYKGRKEYCSSINPKRCVRGFDLPININDLNFIDGKIRAMTLPDTNIFSGLPPMALVYFSRQGNDLVYEGVINGIQGVYTEKYNNVRDKLLLPNNFFLK